ncbi:sucrase ferredoxin [Actinosynnema sp. NPDC053489]|uniref:sucrase ferredoxin n=1 Tax=Actinosynnema sp. NPDC053489 TaxID=3363916 RepID=UPI0037CAAA0C
MVTRLLGSSPAGTATMMTSWLLVEAPGPWAANALETTLDGVFDPEVLARARSLGLRPLLIRRPGRHHRTAADGRTVYVASGRPENRWLERIRVADLGELRDLDLLAVARGAGGHGEPVDSSLFLVCTHGKKDMCCAVFGRPVADTLHKNHPDQTWEVSHVGGDVWAGNLLVVPSGFMHGQLSPDEAALVAKAARLGQVLPDQLRGRSSAPSLWAQYAEITLRKQLGLRGLDAVLTVAERDAEGAAEPGESRVVTVRCLDQTYEVAVSRTRVDATARSRCAGRFTTSSFTTGTVRALTPA